MSNLQIYYHFKLDFQKVDQQTGGKWLIHGTKCRKVIHWLIFPYPTGLLHWHCGNLTIAPVPAKQPWWIWINTSCEFILNDCITTTKQSTTKPCEYFLGYTVRHSVENHHDCHPIVTVYPKKYSHGFVVLCFVVVMQSFIMNSHEEFIHIHQGCFAGTGAIVRLPQCQWSEPDGYEKCITTTKQSMYNHNKAQQSKNRVHISWDILYTPVVNMLYTHIQNRIPIAQPEA